MDYPYTLTLEYNGRKVSIKMSEKQVNNKKLAPAYIRTLKERVGRT